MRTRNGQSRAGSVEISKDVALGAQHYVLEPSRRLIDMLMMGFLAQEDFMEKALPSSRGREWTLHT